MEDEYIAVNKYVFDSLLKITNSLRLQVTQLELIVKELKKGKK